MFEINTTSSFNPKKAILPSPFRERQESENRFSDNVEIESWIRALEDTESFTLLMDYINSCVSGREDSVGFGVFSLYPSEENNTTPNLSKDRLISRLINREIPRQNICSTVDNEFVHFEQSVVREVSKAIIAEIPTSNDSIIEREFEDFYNPLREEQTTPTNERRRKVHPVNWEQELQWFQDNKWVFEKYKGAWVAVKSDKFVTHGAHYQEVLAFCEHNSINNPLIQYIPNSDHEWDIGLGNYVISE